MADPNKSMICTPVAGGIQVVFTHTDGYPEKPTVKVTSVETVTTFGPENMPAVTLNGRGVNSSKVPFTTQTVVVPVSGPGTYTVEGECSRGTFNDTVTVP